MLTPEELSRIRRFLHAYDTDLDPEKK